MVIFLTAPKQSSSNEHSSTFSTCFGFFLAVELENIIGVVLILFGVCIGEELVVAFRLTLRFNDSNIPDDRLLFRRMVGVGVWLLLLLLCPSNEVDRTKKLSSTLRLRRDFSSIFAVVTPIQSSSSFKPLYLYAYEN